MKTGLTVLGLAALAWFNASAQLAVEVTMEQGEFLPSETIPVAVRVTNRSGQPLHLGADANWLTFNVESADGFIVVKNGEVPVVKEFDLGSSQVAIKRVDLQPYFGLARPGRYRVTATVQIKDWSEAMTSPAEEFYVITGAKIWAQDFGVPVPADATNRTPEVRRYTLEKANYLRTQLRLYVQVSDPAEARIFKVVFHRQDGRVRRPGHATGPSLEPAHFVPERRGVLHLRGGEPGRWPGEAGDL